MKHLKERMLALIDDSANQARSFVENFNDMMDSFDMDSHFNYFNEKKNELIKRGNELFGDFDDFFKQVSFKNNCFSVTVPFDEGKGEKISYEVQDGKLNVEVSFEDEHTTKSNKMSVSIPKECIIEGISFDYDSVSKTARITIPKEKKEVAESEKKVIKRDDETEEIITENKTPSKLAQKLKQNGMKYAKALSRMNRGKFVRREPKSE